MKRPLLLTSILALLLVAGVLLACPEEGSPAVASFVSPCEPATDLKVAYTPASVHPGVRVVLTAEVGSGTLPLTYTWAFGDATLPITGVTASAEFTTSHTYTASGVFPVTATAWNSCTVAPATASVLVTVTGEPCLPLTGLSLAYTPTQPYTYTQTLFAGEILTGILPATYTWDFGDGADLVTGTTSAPVVTVAHTFTAARAYTVSLAAWNDCTITPAQESRSLTVGPCEAISGLAATYLPTAVRVGEVVTFTAEIGGGSLPWAFSWSFGDAQKATGAVVTHTYHAALTYTVILTASNPCGHRVVTTTLRVAPPPIYTFLPVVAVEFPLPPEGHLGYGANIASADHAISLTVMGFDWAKGFVTWSEAGRGPSYNWIAVDNQLGEFLPHVHHVLFRVGGPPPPDVANPPTSDEARTMFRSFVQALATYVSNSWRAQGLETVAYEIWNEPNLDYEWGGPPSAAQYTALLKAAYEGIKAGDPRAIVVSAGLATTGDSVRDLALARELYNAAQVVSDLTFLRNMYLNGAKGYFDALGSHPYGGADAPATPPAEASGPIYFRRAEEQHQVMIANGDNSPVWATEFGWVLETDCHLGEHEWLEVEEKEQAEYLAAAYAYADGQWPWMGPMFLFNLDFGTCYWYDKCDAMRWYSITYREDPYDPGHSPIQPRQAVFALRDLPKHSAW
jgi:PKD repeat protein